MRFVLLGGFLGSGKTTTLARLARHYRDEGQRVAIVTNDQADDLVDTFTLSAVEANTGQVAGSCFCCDFDGLMSVIDGFEAGGEAPPDVVLAEPVGSCTDLVATVIRPMLERFPGRFTIAPYAVLLKPAHAGQALRGEVGELTPGAAYIYRKQLEEADAIVINRADELDPDHADRLAAMAREAVPQAAVLTASAKTGQGFDALLALLSGEGRFTDRSMEVDYELYARGEADLGWLNAVADLEGASVAGLDDVLMHAMQLFHARLAARSAEVAHVKVLGQRGGEHAVVNLTDSRDDGPVVSAASGAKAAGARLVINARVAVDPETLEAIARDCFAEAAWTAKLTLRFGRAASFRPAPPRPTYRIV